MKERRMPPLTGGNPIPVQLTARGARIRRPGENVPLLITMEVGEGPEHAGDSKVCIYVHGHAFDTIFWAPPPWRVLLIGYRETFIPDMRGFAFTDKAVSNQRHCLHEPSDDPVGHMQLVVPLGFPYAVVAT